jgi:uncharacterized membrane protein
MKPPIIPSPREEVVEDSFSIADFNEVFSSSTLDSVVGFFDGLWMIYTILAYIFCIFLIIVYTYAEINRKELKRLASEEILEKERLYAEMYKGGPRQDRLTDVNEHIASDNPNDWKLAIIEADIILDEALKELGYVGDSLGERLRGLTARQLPGIDDAWQAHKVRNQIAHGGMDFVLTNKLANDTIKQYQRVFNDIGIR